jgi:hypothetical protein
MFRKRKVSLLVTDTPELYQVCLEQSDAKGQVYAHDPKFRRAQEMAICGICQEDLHQVDVEEADGCDGEGLVADLDEGKTAIDDQKCHTTVEEDGPGDDEASVEFAQVIPIDQ